MGQYALDEARALPEEQHKILRAVALSVLIQPLPRPIGTGLPLFAAPPLSVAPAHHRAHETA